VTTKSKDVGLAASNINLVARMNSE